jgi:hypothetical protein
MNFKKAIIQFPVFFHIFLKHKNDDDEPREWILVIHILTFSWEIIPCMF